MKKLFLTSVAVFATAAGLSAHCNCEHHVTIKTSCGVEVDMVYEKQHTGLDVAKDALILEEYFCGEDIR